MKTNFAMIKELEAKFAPKRFGTITKEEVELIRSTLCLDEMDVLQLQNLRDFTVIYFSQTDTLEDMDKMSAIVSVIDTILIVERGIMQ